MVRRYLYFALVALAVSSACQSENRLPTNEGQLSPTATRKSTVTEVDLCNLLNRPAEFDGREIRVSAILIAGFESAFAYDPRCVSDDRLIWFEIKSDSVSQQIEPYFVPETEEFRSKGLNRMRGRFVGMFETKKKDGFGHLNSANHKITITDASDLHTVEPSETYPW